MKDGTDENHCAIQDGIKTADDLKAALQIAIQLEFSTIPPYLCAAWSLDYNNDPDLHSKYCLPAQNAIVDASFVPQYPTNGLPGDIAQNLAIDLLSLSPTH
jgi:Ferritin-like